MTIAKELRERDLIELSSLLSLPSVSADRAHKEVVRSTANWICDFVCGAGGSAELIDWHGSPLVDARIPASVEPESAPTVLCYGHFDVQPPGRIELWESDPFTATMRDGWLYARGVADDKGQLWALLRAAADVAGEGELPINVRFCCDGEEEIGGTSIVEFLDAHADDPVACVIFDTPMLDRDTHVFTTATRGTLYLHVDVKTSARDLHSGIYGGAALNALHVLTRALDSLFDEYGRPAEPLRVGYRPASPAERDGWRELPPGAQLLADQCAIAADDDASANFYERTWELPSLDINGIDGGSPTQQKTIVVAEACANLSMRLAVGQTKSVLLPIIENQLKSRIPAAAHVDITELSSCEPGRVRTDSKPVTLAAAAFERVLGRRPLMLRSGGSLPIMPLLEQKGIPGIVTGFAVPDSNMHAPNERMRLSDLSDALEVAREMFRGFAAI